LLPGDGRVCASRSGYGARVIMVVAATQLEADLVDDAQVRVVVCGIGPVEAALATADALAASRPAAVLQIGIAGAQTLPHGSLAIGSESVYCDVLDAEARIPRVERIAPAPHLLEAARRALPDAHVLPIATSGRVGGGAACEVEAMEGFGVLRAAALAGVPAVEIRAVSNPVAERDRDRWQVGSALDVLRGALPSLLAEVGRA
jgi:futalosine hydrolase